MTTKKSDKAPASAVPVFDPNNHFVGPYGDVGFEIDPGRKSGPGPKVVPATLGAIVMSAINVVTRGEQGLGLNGTESACASYIQIMLAQKKPIELDSEKEDLIIKLLDWAVGKSLLAPYARTSVLFKVKPGDIVEAYRTVWEELYDPDKMPAKLKKMREESNEALEEFKKAMVEAEAAKAKQPTVN